MLFSNWDCVTGVWSRESYISKPCRFLMRVFLSLNSSMTNVAPVLQAGSQVFGKHDVLDAPDVMTFITISNKLSSLFRVNTVAVDVMVLQSVIRCYTQGMTGIWFPAEALGFRSSSIRVIGHNVIDIAYPEDAWSEFSCSVTNYPYRGSGIAQDTTPPFQIIISSVFVIIFSCHSTLCGSSWTYESNT